MISDMGDVMMMLYEDQRLVERCSESTEKIRVDEFVMIE